MNQEQPALDLLQDENLDGLSIDPLDNGQASTDFTKLTFDSPKLEETTGFAYPALLLCNVGFHDVLRVLKAYRRDSYRCIDVWVSVEDTYSNIGTLQLTSDVLLLLKRLSIKVIAYWDAERTEVVDLNDPRLLEKFI